MTTDPLIDQARTAFARRAWTEAADAFAAADRQSSLDLADLEQASMALHLIGNDDGAVEILSRAHHEATRTGQVPRAARHAFWLGMMHVQRGDMAQAGGWMSRAARLLDESDADCVERGYVLIPQGLRALDSGDPAAAFEVFDRAATIAARFGDQDLATMGRLGRGRSLIGMSEIERGVALLDEAMLAAATGEVSPIVVGIVYCASIEAFQEIFDLRRAQEWTTALSAWCDSQPDMIPFRGRCLVYRAELLQFHGAWPEAANQAERAQILLLRPPPEPAVGEAFYRQAELHRLRGEFDAADDAYRESSQWGRRPDPGLALLRLAQGQAKAASSMIRRAVDEAVDDAVRARLLEPAIEIALAGGDVTAARPAANELARIAAASSAPLIRAIAARAEGCVLLADGDPRGALAALRWAESIWKALDSPYESARLRISVGLALRELGDRDTAQLEFDAARRVLQTLGAAPDLARLDALIGAAVARPGGLSAREAEVLRLLVAGRTNRAIAEDLGISERTVERHVSNIFAKLDVSSRSAATAYAYEHDLV
jgi:DNA-binding CsgD family transcriptional regulator